MIKTLDQYYININRICGHQILEFDDNKNMSENQSDRFIIKERIIIRFTVSNAISKLKRKHLIKIRIAKYVHKYKFHAFQINFNEILKSV